MEKPKADKMHLQGGGYLKVPRLLERLTFVLENGSDVSGVYH